MSNIFSVLIIAFAVSGLRVTSQLYIYNIFLLFGIIVLLFNPNSISLFKYKHKKWIAIFLFVIIPTMLIRGVGFQALGGNMVGGMNYVNLISVLIFSLMVNKVTLTEQQLKHALIATTLLSFLPFLSDVMFMIYGGNTFFNDIIQGSTTIEENFNRSEQGSLFRLQSAGTTAQYLISYGLVVFPIRTLNGKYNPKIIIMILLSLILGGISGHRLAFVYIILILALFLILKEKKIKYSRYFLKVLLVVVFVIISLVFMIDYLPMSFQRMLSFLPFVKTSQEASLDASGSWEFRLVMWGIGVTQIPDYWLIGKGLAATPIITDINDQLSAMEGFLQLGTYHNGLLGLLLNFGILGLISGVAILIMAIKTLQIPINWWKEHSSWLYRYYIIMRATLILNVVGYVFFYGDVQVNYPYIILNITILEIIINSKTKSLVKKK